MLIYRHRKSSSRNLKSLESLDTTPSVEFVDPLQPSASDVAVAVGTGRAISPEEIERELEVIKKRDDAHRLVNIGPSPPPRFLSSTVTVYDKMVILAIIGYRSIRPSVDPLRVDPPHVRPKRGRSAPS